MAIGLVVVVLTVLQLPARQLHMSSFWLEKASYALVGVLGVLLCWRALKNTRAAASPDIYRFSRRIMCMMNAVVAGISMCPTRNSCKAAMTGAPG